MGDQRPGRDDVPIGPICDLAAETGFARSEILGAMVEGDLAQGGVKAPGGHAPAGPAPLVEQGDHMAGTGQHIGAGEPRHAGADNRKSHR
jgi:hypothetical protein